MSEEQETQTKQPAPKRGPAGPAAKPAARTAATGPAARSTATKSAATKPAATKSAKKKVAAGEPDTDKPVKPGAKSPSPQKAAPAKAAPDEAALTASQPSTIGEEPPSKEATAMTPATGDSHVAENPLHKKLGIRPETTGIVIAPPDESDNPLAPLPDGFSALDEIDELDTITGPFAYIHVFARERGELAGAFAILRDRLDLGGSLWISWMKQSSNRRGGALSGDLNENTIRRIALTHGMVDTKIIALDRHWAALRLVHRRR